MTRHAVVPACEVKREEQKAVAAASPIRVEVLDRQNEEAKVAILGDAAVLKGRTTAERVEYFA